jgi:hypothetical protein
MQHDATQHLPPYRVRPRFQTKTPFSPAELIQKIRLRLDSPDATCKGQITDIHYATIYIPAEDQHYWSPQLSLTVEEQEESGSLLRGLYGPRPAIWTMFVFFYCIIGFATLVILMLGLSYMSLDLPASILWFIPVLIILFLSLYLVAYLGQRKGHDQMVTLHQFIEDALGMDIR